MKHDHAGGAPLSPEKLRLSARATNGPFLLLIALGLACVGVTVALGWLSKDAAVQRQALASYHTGFLVALSLSLGALVFVMILQQVNAGWTALLRRQYENIMDLFGPLFVLFIPVLLSIFTDHPLWKWMNPDAVAGDPIFATKRPFLNTNFFLLRVGVYFGVWLVLSRLLYRYSVRQDETGDRWLTARARKISSFGLLLFALTTAFASFDWIMGLDYHFFSTMYGVYFFAGSIGAALCLGTLVILTLRRAGPLRGLVTDEHLHDLGKLAFAFSVFWAYIGFSQYFLIWYANIPEETAWFIQRRNDGWLPYSEALAIGRFIVPFIILMPRPWRRNPVVLGFMCVWIVGFNALDLFWQVRPNVVNEHGVSPLFNWLDGVAIAGPVCLYLAVLVKKIGASPLVPLRDPRLPESLHHQNYV